MSNEKPTAKLHMTDMRKTPSGNFSAEGYVYNHPEIKDHTFVTTSRVVRIDFEKGELETRNTKYKMVDGDGGEI